MKIDDIESKKLLPNWAHDADWIQAAFDQIVLMCAGRLPAIDAPLTMKAIQCLTDEELREWYARFGVIEYYPDLNRETRESMLYWLARLYRFLGTPHAIRVLCDYIYNDLPLDVTVIDNLAFDGETLVDPTLLDLFDVEIDAGSAGISPAQAYRLVNNILRIARNSQTLRKIIYDYASDIDVNCGACSYGGDACIDYSDNDEIARDVTPPAPALPTVSLMVYNGNEWNYPYSFNDTPHTFVSGAEAQLYIAPGASFLYGSDRVYSVGEYQYPSGTTTGRSGFSIISVNSNLGCKNISGGSITIQRMSVYQCSDSTAISITVYDSSNNPFNSFKFTTNNTDYYYVLDGTQTDWTDDLASIGYRLDMQFYFYFSMNSDNPVDVTFDYPYGNNFWGLRVRNQSEKDILDSIGLLAASQYPASAPYGYLKAHTAQTSFSYELKAIFLPDGTQAPFSLSDFYCYTSNNVVECVRCSSSYSTPVRSCLISIKPIS